MIQVINARKQNINCYFVYDTEKMLRTSMSSCFVNLTSLLEMYKECDKAIRY